MNLLEEDGGRIEAARLPGIIGANSIARTFGGMRRVAGSRI
jgi:hypothetical protein